MLSSLGSNKPLHLPIGRPITWRELLLVIYLTTFHQFYYRFSQQTIIIKFLLIHFNHLSQYTHQFVIVAIDRYHLALSLSMPNRPYHYATNFHGIPINRIVIPEG